jgi:hypothetical protein
MTALRLVSTLKLKSILKLVLMLQLQLQLQLKLNVMKKKEMTWLCSCGYRLTIGRGSGGVINHYVESSESQSSNKQQLDSGSRCFAIMGVACLVSDRLNTRIGPGFC